jgi:hypothetical protein
MMCGASTHLQFKQIVVHFIAPLSSLKMASILPDDLDPFEHHGQAHGYILPAMFLIDLTITQELYRHLFVFRKCAPRLSYCLFYVVNGS